MSIVKVEVISKGFYGVIDGNLKEFDVGYQFMTDYEPSVHSSKLKVISSEPAFEVATPEVDSDEQPNKRKRKSAESDSDV